MACPPAGSSVTATVWTSTGYAALLVSQRFHLPRAVALCRSLGVDADGVAARCDDCRTSTLATNRAREIPAAWKAALDRARDRPPAVVSSPDPRLTAALRDAP